MRKLIPLLALAALVLAACSTPETTFTPKGAQSKGAKGIAHGTPVDGLNN